LNGANIAAAAAHDQDCDISTTAAKQARMDQVAAPAATITTIPFALPMASPARAVGTPPSLSAASNDGMLCLEEMDEEDNATDWGSISPAKQLGPGGVDMDWPWSLATGSGSDSDDDQVQVNKSVSSPSITYPPSPASPPPASAILMFAHHPSPDTASLSTASNCVTGAATKPSTPAALTGPVSTVAKQEQSGMPPAPASHPQTPDALACAVMHPLPDDHVPFGIAISSAGSLGNKRPPSSPQLTLGAAAVKYPRLARSDTSPEPCLTRTSVHLLSSSPPPSPAAGADDAPGAHRIAATTDMGMANQPQQNNGGLPTMQLYSQDGPQPCPAPVEDGINCLSFTSQLLVQELVAEVVCSPWDASLSSTPVAPTDSKVLAAERQLEIVEDSPEPKGGNTTSIRAGIAAGISMGTIVPFGASSLGSIGSSFLHEDPTDANKENLPPPGHACWADEGDYETGVDCGTACPDTGIGSPGGEGMQKEQGSPGSTLQDSGTPATPSSGLLPVSYHSDVCTPPPSSGGAQGYDSDSATPTCQRTGMSPTGYTATTDATSTDNSSSDGSTALGTKLVAVSMVHAWSGSGTVAHGLDYPGPVDHSSLGPGRNLLTDFDGREDQHGLQPGVWAQATTVAHNCPPAQVDAAARSTAEGSQCNMNSAEAADASPTTSSATTPASTPPASSDGPGSGSRHRLSSKSMLLWHWADVQ
jgi:hypothetical protein